MVNPHCTTQMDVLRVYKELYSHPMSDQFLMGVDFSQNLKTAYINKKSGKSARFFYFTNNATTRY